jgi:hypothetical protein
MAKIFEKDGNRIVMRDDANIADWPGYSEIPSPLNWLQRRLTLLEETDVWALTDRTMTAEQIAYRQALRDITDQAGFPNDITWPTKPE